MHSWHDESISNDEEDVIQTINTQFDNDLLTEKQHWALTDNQSSSPNILLAIVLQLTLNLGKFSPHNVWLP
jgi:hypothetical protein